MLFPALVAFLLNTVSLSLAVDLTLVIDVLDSDQTCIGNGIGLTDTSILVEYRIVDTTRSQTSVGEWRGLANVMETTSIQTQLHDSAEGGFQLRLLQLEHGGGMCNCWTVERISVNCGGGIVDTSTDLCGHQGFANINLMLFCFDYASRARGMITEVYCSVSNNSEPCPGDSDTLLPSGGPSFPSHCEASDFRM